jgi:double-stranded uracil-DNA glycosylase
VVDTHARVLILGTLPGEESLKMKRYYAKKTNTFWRIMGDLLGDLPDGYEDRLKCLKKSGIALWDVCLSCERAGSLDSRIVTSTVVANDFGTFLRTYPSIRLICFNGSTAEKLFRRKVNADFSGIRYELLPSSSAAHAITYERKSIVWRNILGSATTVR